MVIRLYKLYDITSYTYNVKVYFGKGGHCMAQLLTATHATVTGLMMKVGHNHKLYVDSFFFP